MGCQFFRLFLILILAVIPALDAAPAKSQALAPLPDGGFRLEAALWPSGPQGAAGEMEELGLGIGLETNSLAPWEQTTTLSSNLVDLIFDSFFFQTQGGEIQARLATGLTFSRDGLEATLYLRPGVRFSDGLPLTSQAIKTTWDRLLDPGTAVPLGWNLGPVRECLALDEITVMFRLRHPYPALASLLSLSLCSPVSPRSLEQWGDDVRNHPVGAGPYLLKEWIKGERIVLERNENYYGARPTVKRLFWKIVPMVTDRRDTVKSGKMDVCRFFLPADYKILTAEPALRVVAPLSTRTYFMAFNCGRDVLRDKTVRQALNLAVDKRNMVRTVASGVGRPMRSPISLTVPGSRPQKPNFAHDPARAKQLLQASYLDFSRPLRILGCKLRFPFQSQILESIQKDFLKVGVRSEIRFLDWPGFLAELNKPSGQSSVDAFLLDRNSLVLDLGTALRERFHSRAAGPPGNNRGTLYANPLVDSLLDQAQNQLDPANRAKLLSRAETMIWEDCPWLWLYTDKFLVFHRKEVENLTITPTEKIYPQEAVRK